LGVGRGYNTKKGTAFATIVNDTGSVMRAMAVGLQ